MPFEYSLLLDSYIKNHNNIIWKLSGGLVQMLQTKHNATRDDILFLARFASSVFSTIQGESIHSSIYYKEYAGYKESIIRFVDKSSLGDHYGEFAIRVYTSEPRNICLINNYTSDVKCARFATRVNNQFLNVIKILCKKYSVMPPAPNY